MAYLGRNRPTETTSSVLRSTYTGDGSTTTYNLPGPVANETSIIATINGVTQQDAAYTTNGSQIIFDAAPASGDAIEIRTLSAVAMSYAPMAGSVTTGILADGAVTTGKINDAAVTAAKLASGAAVANIGTRAIGVSQVPAGSVLQVLQAVKADTQSTTSATFGDITGLSVSITPTSASSKILITASVGRGTDTNQITNFQLLRDSTAIGIGDTAGSRVRATMSMYFGASDAISHIGTATMTYLDSPATTSATTYKVQFRSQAGGQTSYINRNASDGDSNIVPRTISTITVMEIAA